MVIASAEIEGGHGLPFDCRDFAVQLQNTVNAVKFWCGNYNILQKSSMRFSREVIKGVNKKEDEYEEQKKGLV